MSNSFGFGGQNTALVFRRWDAMTDDASTAPAAATARDAELLGLIDRLATLLDRSDLTELEVESGGTGLVLRKPSALAPITVASVGGAVAGGDGHGTGGGRAPPQRGRDRRRPPSRRSRRR